MMKVVEYQSYASAMVNPQSIADIESSIIMLEDEAMLHREGELLKSGDECLHRPLVMVIMPAHMHNDDRLRT